MISTFFWNSSLGLEYVQYATLHCYWHWTLGLVFFLLLRIVLIQLLAAKPNKSIIIILFIYLKITG